jgi:hypothetical protein
MAGPNGGIEHWDGAAESIRNKSALLIAIHKSKIALGYGVALGSGPVEPL